MKKQVGGGIHCKRSVFLQGLIIVVALLIMISVWPLKWWQTKEVREVARSEYETVLMESSEGRQVYQEFIPEFGYIEQIDVTLDTLATTYGKMYFRLFGPDGTLLLEKEGYFEENQKVETFSFPIAMAVNPGQMYSYRLDYGDASFAVCYTDKEEELEGGNASLVIDGQPFADKSLLSRYEYKSPLTRMQKIMIWGSVIALGILLSAWNWIVVYVLKKDKTILLEKSCANVLSIAFSLSILYALFEIFINQRISFRVADNIVYAVGVILLGAVMVFASRRFAFPSFMKSKEGLQKFCTKTPEYLRTLFFAGSILGCCDFINAVSNYEQFMATRKMLFFLGLVLVVSFAKTFYLHWITFVYAALAVCVGFFYVRGLEGEPLNLAIRSVGAVSVWILVMAYTLLAFWKKQLPRLTVIPTALMGLFFVGMSVFSHGNRWVWVMVLPFTVLYLRKFEGDEVERFLNNASSGIIVSFLFMTGKALLYRPFHYFVFTRYPGYFHTVTFTSVYLVVVFAAILSKYVFALQKSTRLRDTWKELSLLGLVSGFQFLTLSRTGILASAVVFVAAMGLKIIYEKEKTIQNLLLPILLPILAVVSFIPITFTAARVVPAVVNKPHLFVGEWFSESIQNGEPVNSRRYITVERFLGLSFERVLNKVKVEENYTVSINGIAVDKESVMKPNGTLDQKAIEQIQKEMAKNEGTQEKGDQEEGTQESVGQESPKTGVTITADSGVTMEVTTDYTNGRSDILKEYLKQLNWTGHPIISLTTEGGESIIHAHNSFVQVAFDHGIPVGILFLILCSVFGIRSILYYRNQSGKKEAIFPFVILVSFAMSGMVEYVFRATIPLGLAFLIVILPLLQKQQGKE